MTSYSTSMDNISLSRTVFEIFDFKVFRVWPWPLTPKTVSTFDTPSPVSLKEVLDILNSIPAKSSPLDFIPTSLLKSCSGVFSVLISNLANLSFSQGTFPTMFKLAQVTPILEKPGLPSTDPANFRPISNLNNISKILERLFLSRLLPHINSSSNFNSFLSAYRPHHSTETALTFTLDNVFHAADTGSATLLVSLDLSAAFDSINHNILISRLSSCFGLTGLALDWISSYLHNRRQSVKIGDACSPLSDITSGVPQGFVLGPILFALYTLPISAIADAHGVLQQQYADDTQLYISVSAKTIAPNTRRLEACLSDLHAWFSHNWLALNPSKSEALLLGTSQRLKTLATLGSVNISGTTVPLKPRSNSLVSLLTSLFHLTPTSLLYLNHVSITFAPFTTSDQFLVKAPPISSPALLSLPGWTMPMLVCLASQTRICLAYRGFRTHLLGLLHSPDHGPAQPPFWNTSTGFQSQLGSISKLLSLLLSHSMP